MMRRLLERLGPFVLAFILIVSISTVPVSAAKQTFKDVPPNKWYYNIVENLAGQGIVSGYPDGSFRPDNKVERQHVCVMVMKGAGIKNSGKKANFPDVPKTSEFSSFIATMADKGIVNGFPDGTFKPKNPVTRGQAAIMIARAFGLKSVMHIEDFKDTEGHYAANHIRILNSHGVINGYPDGAFKPDAPVTRAEISKMISFAMTASSGSTKHQPDPKIQEAENVVRYAERGNSVINILAAQVLVEGLADSSTRQQLQARLDRIYGCRYLYEAEPNGSRSQANVIDSNSDGTVDYLIWGNIDHDNDRDWYRFIFTRSVDFTVFARCQESVNLSSHLRFYLADADGTPIKYSTTHDYTQDVYQMLTAQVPAGEYYLVISSNDTRLTGGSHIVEVYFNHPKK